ncbi:MarR family transcriptional regulator [Fulvimonas sp. R45]|jgi:MarR family transcriptional repressor of emrRAB|uniref:MarR family winged helix-turn-helix transcriptional regulator n=1 Tax=Fulvimonas sp. R45 TaxID=3045937 RepID=UPI00265EE1FE|nr:MarR family transcriptional regulator [Fulvimonas sp. R45]MDO1527433.1 MarR family transcriptional regulator [Fulvimonas sp. R45]
MNRLNDCIAMMEAGIERMSQALPRLPTADAKLCRLTMMVGTSMQRGLEEKLAPHGLGHSEFLTLVILYTHPDGSLSPGELCDFASQGATNMTRIGNALVKRGLIVRGASETDRRRVLIRITPAGRRFVQKILPPMFPHVDAMFAGFSDTDKRHLSRLLRKLANNLDQLDADTAP